MRSRATLFYRAAILLIETTSMTVTVRNVTRENVYGALTNAGFQVTTGWARSETKQWAHVQRRQPELLPTQFRHQRSVGPGLSEALFEHGS